MKKTKEELAEIRREAGKLGGRPRKSESEIEKARIASLNYLKERYIGATEKIANAQLGLAVGSQYLYKVITYKKGGRSRPELVEDQATIESYLNGDFDSGRTTAKGDEEFYFLTAKDPDNRAIDSIQNRLHGRPKETIDLQNTDGSLKTIIIKKEK
jgi:hypothetical protein